jgi:hypothetical protein
MRFFPERVPLCIAACCGSIAWAHEAMGQEPPRPDAPDNGEEQAEPAGRAAPPEEARGWEAEPGVAGEDVALFVPRAILTPPRLILQAVFWPIKKGLELTQENYVVEEIIDLLYNDERTAAVLPVALYSSDQGLSLGFKAFHRGLGVHEEEIAVSGRYGGRYEQSWELSFETERAFDAPVYLSATTRYEVEPDLLFAGYGMNGDDDEAGGDGPRDLRTDSRFRQRRGLLLLSGGAIAGGPGAEGRFGGLATYNTRRFSDGDGIDDDPLTSEVYDTSRLPGFEEGVDIAEVLGTVSVDTRDSPGLTGSGFSLHLFGGGAPPQKGFAYGRAGGAAVTYINLYRRTRVLVLRIAHEVAIAEEADIPFTELPRLGGPHRLRGYEQDQFRDKKTSFGTLEYHYPIHAYISGSLFVDAGRAASTYERLVDLEDWRLGVGGGFLIHRDDLLLTTQLAYGDGFHFIITTDPLRAFEDQGERL